MSITVPLYIKAMVCILPLDITKAVKTGEKGLKNEFLIIEKNITVGSLCSKLRGEARC
jgi:hypothetical protein